jgi:hypothetical protein
MARVLVDRQGLLDIRDAFLKTPHGPQTIAGDDQDLWI